MLLNEDAIDAALFRFWIRMATDKPSKVASAIAHCTSPDEYRAALTSLASKERINLPVSP